jgi:hypothetical protein
MKTLIEKWKPLMQYKFKDGNSVPIEKYQESLDRLEKLIFGENTEKDCSSSKID